MRLDPEERNPHRVRTFKVSNDPDFIEKVTDIALYPNAKAARDLSRKCGD